MTRQGSLRGRWLLTGALGYFFYTYGAMSFLTAFNPFYLIYVGLSSLSLFGFILASLVLLKILSMGAALIAMVINQMLEKVAIDPVTSVFFVLISLSGMVLAEAALRGIRDEAAVHSFAHKS